MTPDLGDTWRLPRRFLFSAFFILLPVVQATCSQVLQQAPQRIGDFRIAPVVANAIA